MQRKAEFRSSQDITLGTRPTSSVKKLSNKLDNLSLGHKGNEKTSNGGGGRRKKRMNQRQQMKALIEAEKEATKAKQKKTKAKMKKGPTLESLPDPKDEAHSGRNEEDKKEKGSSKSVAAPEKNQEGTRCHGCGAKLSETAVAGSKVRVSFREHGGKRYCEDCHKNDFAPRCTRCGYAIPGTVTQALQKAWHPECLRCVLCNAQLQNNFYLKDDKPGQPYCSFCVKGVPQHQQRLQSNTIGGGTRTITSTTQSTVFGIGGGVSAFNNAKQNNQF
mmetsp:Transcript_44423/g.69453  ORF Transcript_44423/g.69453 Transcript_44423/m.69453 type:complete len:274 (+) Transcript_44423:1013-1834(+)